MHSKTIFRCVLLLVFASPAAAQEKLSELLVDPCVLTLRGPGAVQSLLVTGKTLDGRLVDLTHDAKYETKQTQITNVTSSGVLRAKSDGEAEVLVSAGGLKAKVQIDVKDTTKPRSVHFENDIVPLLNRFGCNSSGCHGYSQGQNG